MKVLNVAFCIDNNYVNHLMVTIYSLLKNNKDENIHIHIVAPDLTKESKAVINSLKEIGVSVKISYHTVDPASISGLAITMNYISSVTYYRLLLAEIIPSTIDTLLYLDADILVYGKLDRLMKTPLD